MKIILKSFQNIFYIEHLWTAAFHIPSNNRTSVPCACNSITLKAVLTGADKRGKSIGTYCIFVTIVDA